MRVTHRTMQDAWIRNLQNRLENMDRLSRQIGSGVRLERPSDDPSGAARIVRIEEVVARNQQYLKNIEEALSVQNTTSSALDQVNQNLVRAKSLAVEAANSASVPQAGSFGAIADEVAGIRESILRVAMSRHEDTYLFNGTMGDAPPYGTDGGPYAGNSNLLRVNAGNGRTVAVNLPGDFAFRETDARSREPFPAGGMDFTGTPATFTLSDGHTDPPVSVTLNAFYATPQDAADEINNAIDAYETANGVEVNVEARANADNTLSIAIADSEKGGELTLGGTEALNIDSGTKNIFGLLDDLETALRAEDGATVGRLLGRLDRSIDDLVGQRGQLGARSRNLEFARDQIEAFNVTSEALRADIEGVDVAEAVMRVTSEEQAYQTALASGARLFNISILDFLG